MSEENQVQAMPELTPVESSNLKGVAYQNGMLFVGFINGSVYRYDNVPQEMFDNMMAADSKGSFYAQNIKGTYDGTRVDNQPPPNEDTRDSYETVAEAQSEALAETPAPEPAPVMDANGNPHPMEAPSDTQEVSAEQTAPQPVASAGAGSVAVPAAETSPDPAPEIEGYDGPNVIGCDYNDEQGLIVRFGNWREEHIKDAPSELFHGLQNAGNMTKYYVAQIAEKYESTTHDTQDPRQPEQDQAAA